MKIEAILILVLCFSFVSSANFGIDNPTIPHINPTATVNVRSSNVTNQYITNNFINGSSYNATYESTYNSTYALWAYNQSFNTSLLSTIYYNATQFDNISGTYTGILANTQHQNGEYDGISMNLTESITSPALDFRFNFTGISSFTSGIMRYKTSALVGTTPIIQLWDYVNNRWEDYPAISDSTNFNTISQPVFDSSEHVSNGIVQMRIYKSSTGNPNNKYYIDWLAIAKGYGVPSGQEIDPYSWHRNNTGEYGNFYTRGNVSMDRLNADSLNVSGGLIITDNSTAVTGYGEDAHVQIRGNYATAGGSVKSIFQVKNQNKNIFSVMSRPDFNINEMSYGNPSQTYTRLWFGGVLDPSGRADFNYNQGYFGYDGFSTTFIKGAFQMSRIDDASGINGQQPSAALQFQDSTWTGSSYDRPDLNVRFIPYNGYNNMSRLSFQGRVLGTYAGESFIIQAINWRTQSISDNIGVNNIYPVSHFDIVEDSPSRVVLGIKGALNQAALLVNISNSTGYTLVDVTGTGDLEVKKTAKIYQADLSRINLTNSNGTLVSGLYENNDRFLTIKKTNPNQASFIYMYDAQLQRQINILPNGSNYATIEIYKGNSPSVCSLELKDGSTADVCFNTGTYAMSTTGSINVGNIDTGSMTATGTVGASDLSATNGVSGSTGSFSTLTYSSSDPEAFGMLNVTRDRFLTLIRASCTPQYAGALWNYFNGTRMFYVKPLDCHIYKKVMSADGYEDYIDSGIDIRLKGDVAPCYNNNVRRVQTTDAFTNQTIIKETPILPYAKTAEVIAR